MKRLILPVVAAMLVMGAVQSCKKKDNDTTTTTPTTSTSFMKATVGAATYSVTGTSQAYASGSSSGGINLQYIYGVAANKQSIKITLINNTGPGTQAIGSGNVSAEYDPYGFDSTYSPAVSGSVTVTAITPNITGTFSFTCADSTHVTNGSFSVVAP